ncbi:hypothetical protein [Streptomyces sp. NPDC048272]|uniref:hypothetical protein n=1 Tax=Streptomyces sp. NPDC048272 TaxID=3154616 RepID=UPI003448F007
MSRLTRQVAPVPPGQFEIALPKVAERFFTRLSTHFVSPMTLSIWPGERLYGLSGRVVQ